MKHEYETKVTALKYKVKDLKEKWGWEHKWDKENE